MTEALHFPPLLWGQEAAGPAFDHACLRATQGCDAGLVAYRLGKNLLEVALVFAPEVPLSRAVTMLPLCGVGFQNALGALAPPEVAVHLEWAGGLRINGAKCGRFRMAASDPDPDQIPDWLVVGLELPLWPEDSAEAHIIPDQTVLYAEGCVDVAAPDLLEAYARHTLNWIGRWEDEGAKPLHAEWRGLAHGMGEELTHGDQTGTFLGVDEDFGLLLRQGEATTLLPLTTLLEDPE